MQNLQKRIAQLEGDLDQAQTQLDEATQKLENTDKQLANVSRQLVISGRLHINFLKLGMECSFQDNVTGVFLYITN